MSIKQHPKYPDIVGDFSINPMYVKSRTFRRIVLNKNETLGDLYKKNPEKLNEETYLTINVIINEIEKIINENNSEKIDNQYFKDISVEKASSIVLNKFKYSNQISELLLYKIIENVELKERSYKLQKESITDPLTGLGNRRLIEKKLDENIEKAERAFHEFSILILDIDFFKKINDTFGHDVGDLALKGIAEIIKEKTRKTDTLARWGGEEFLVILDSINHDLALKKAEDIRKEIEKSLIYYIKNDVNYNLFCPHKKGCTKESQCKNHDMMCFPNKITCSIGVATLRQENGEIESKSHLVKRADSALYIAKEGGRNMIYSGTGLEIPKKED